MRIVFSSSLVLVSASLLALPACSSGDDSSPSAPSPGDGGGSGASTDAGSSADSSTISADSGPTGTPSPDAGTGAETGGAGSGCNTFADDAPVVPIEAVTGAAPAPTGGSLRDGVYQVTQATIYGSPVATALPSSSAQGTLEISGSQLADRTVVTLEGTTTTRDEIAVYTFDGNGTVAGADTCPANGGAASLSYTATATGFVVYATGGDGAALTWTLTAN